MRRSEDQVDCQPDRFREWITQHRSQNRQHDSAVFQGVPRRIRPGRIHHDHKSEREQCLDGDEIERVRTEEVIRLTALEENPAVGTSLLDIEESCEQASVPAVGTPEEKRTPQLTPRRLTRNVRVRWVGHRSVLVFDCQSSGTIQAPDGADRERVAQLNPAHCMGLVRRLDCTDLIFREHDIQCADGAFQMLDLGSANDWCGDAWFLK